MRQLMIMALCGVLLFGATPDDIETSSQRAWYDAVDIDADSDYTDNPSNNSLIHLWQDKSGNGKDVSMGNNNGWTICLKQSLGLSLTGQR